MLVVEDDLSAYRGLAQALSEAGYFPMRARRGDEAVAMARALRPTAITLDIGLPGLDGWEVLRQLKQDGQTRGIPVVIVSMMDNRELGLSLGVDDYFQKPVDRERLVARLRELAPPGQARAVSRLLVIDDDPEVHALLGEELRALGFAPEHAHSGPEGLEMAARSRPDAVVLDLHMPGMSGFDVASALRERPETADLPVVVLTALELDAADQARLQDKIQALVHKGPLAPSRLVAAIRDLARRQEETGVAGVARPRAGGRGRRGQPRAGGLPARGGRLRGRCARDLDEARRALQAEAPDVVLMDMSLKGADGLELVAELRADPRLRALPVLALTAHAMRGDRERFLAAGCDGYIAKPIDVKSFVPEVVRHLRRDGGEGA